MKSVLWRVPSYLGQQESGWFWKVGTECLVVRVLDYRGSDVQGNGSGVPALPATKYYPAVLATVISFLNCHVQATPKLVGHVGHSACLAPMCATKIMPIYPGAFYHKLYVLIKGGGLLKTPPPQKKKIACSYDSAWFYVLRFIFRSSCDCCFGRAWRPSSFFGGALQVQVVFSRGPESQNLVRVLILAKIIRTCMCVIMVTACSCLFFFWGGDICCCTHNLYS